MSAGQRFKRDDIVATVARIGPGIEKRRVGEVIEVGAHGCRVSFYDGEELWLPGGRLFHVVDRNGVQELTRERPADPPRRLRAVRNDEPEETANVRRNTDPTPDDPAPRVYHNGLQRTEAYAVLEPVLTLCGDLDAVLTEWREVSP